LTDNAGPVFHEESRAGIVYFGNRPTVGIDGRSSSTRANSPTPTARALAEAARRIFETAESLKRWPEIDLF
jgi:hypothetical protein